VTGKGKTTVRDVAHSAGVSVATVSHVLNGKAYLHTPETVERVRQAASALDYRPNRLAQSLARQRTKTLGIAIETMATGRFTTNPFCIAVLDGILEYTAETDYQVKVVSLRRTDSEYVSARLDDGSVDAVAILAPPADSPSVRWACEAGCPTVVVGSLPPDVPLPRIDVDDERALFEAVCWLIGLGHERIGIITGPPSQWSAVRRERAYTRALSEAGLTIDPALRYAGNYEASSGQLGAAALLDANPRPTAIVCGNDAVALGALEALHRLKVRVPDDISILGFDDHEFARWSRPQLTTIRQPHHEMGVKAAEILISAVETGSPKPDSSVIYPGVLVKRQSVAAPSLRRPAARTATSAELCRTGKRSTRTTKTKTHH